MKRLTSDIVYYLNVEDLQTVARSEIGRDLSDKELELVKKDLGNFIDWFSAVQLSIVNLEIPA